MTVLAFDTATSSCAIVVWREGEVLAKAQEFLERGHAEVLVPMIEKVLAEAKLDYQDLDLLAVTVGPGAFTGIRIGLATARSLSLAGNLPLIGVTNFEALAHATLATERVGSNVLVILETKRADFYAGLFDENLSPLCAPKAVDEAALLEMAGGMSGGMSGEKSGQHPLLLIGDALKRALPALQTTGVEIAISSSGPHVEPAIVAELAMAVFEKGVELGVSLDPVLPLYLKPPDVNMTGVKPVTRIFKQ